MGPGRRPLLNLTVTAELLRDTLTGQSQSQSLKLNWNLNSWWETDGNELENGGCPSLWHDDLGSPRSS